MVPGSYPGEPDFQFQILTAIGATSRDFIVLLISYLSAGAIAGWFFFQFQSTYLARK